LREAEAVKGAALQRLLHERNNLDAEETRAREEAQRLRQRLGVSEQDLARERVLEQDAAAALAGLEGEAGELETANARSGENLAEAEERVQALAARLAEREQTSDRLTAELSVEQVTGRLDAMFYDRSYSGNSLVDVTYASSADGGITWSEPQKVSGSPAGTPAFTPAVDVNDSGTVAVTYYDFRYDTPDTATALTDYWIRTSTDRGATWAPSQRVTPTSFDMKKAPIAGGYFIGDYQGLDHAGDTFKLFFVQTNSTNDGSNPTDVYAADVTS